jgi:hypothetical protein
MGCKGRCCFGIPAAVICDELLAYKTAKLVRVQNYKVGLLYRGLQLGVIALFTTQLAYYHSYLRYTTPTAWVRASVEPPAQWEQRSLAGLGYCSGAQVPDWDWVRLSIARDPPPSSFVRSRPCGQPRHSDRRRRGRGWV